MSTVYDRLLEHRDKGRVVVRVIVSASGTVSTVPDAPNVFHWRFYLALAPSTTPGESQSVTLDMIPANPPTGCLMISSNPTPASRAGVKIELPLATAGSPTVQEIIDLFKAKGMDRYRFDETGSGCLSWLLTGVDHLEQAGLVDAGASEKLRQFHQEQVALHPERHPMPLRQGKFY
ncbi:hypothetical protein BD413DRAFT_92515 [Trametes elegans]|nr:hypothetical protein BD413DRAFT_92515 [Trametes elegans]